MNELTFMADATVDTSIIMGAALLYGYWAIGRVIRTTFGR